MPGGVTAPQTGNEYLDSLRDDRTVFIYGERVKDATPIRRSATRPAWWRGFTTHSPSHPQPLSGATNLRRTGNKLISKRREITPQTPVGANSMRRMASVPSRIRYQDPSAAR